MNKIAIGANMTEQLDDDARWKATQDRDASYDGTFVYAVRSTGIYCRPSCPSRRPRREQVQFFSDGSSAETAGYRACRRCHPNDAPREIAMVEAVNRYIDDHLDEAVTLSMLGEACGVSPFHLQRTFKRVTGLSPHQYLQERRLGRLKRELRTGTDVTTAIYDAGYGSSSRVYEQRSDRLGMSPNTYRRGGRGMEITYTIVDCQLGRVLVGTTERGVCAVCLGESDVELEQALHDEYPEANIHRGEPASRAWVTGVAELAEGHVTAQDLPIDVQATAFQGRVWSYLRSIPAGETRSYGEVAQALEQPTAARAVARACASNPVALIVPCHRVVRGDGEVGGYRWGMERKRSLLTRERETLENRRA